MPGRRLLLSALLLLLAIPGFFLWRRERAAPAPHVRETGAPEPRGTAPASVAASDPLRLPDPQDRGERRKLASQLQRAARKNRDLRDQLAALLLAPSQPPDRRELVAFVLGSLPFDDARRALRKALEAGGDAAWLRTLVLATGSALDREREGTFDYAPGPYVRETPSGLSVEIRRVLQDPELRLAVQDLASHADLELRRTVMQVLFHSLEAEGSALGDKAPEDFGTLRQTFLTVLAKDPDSSLRGEAAWGLGQWLTLAPGASPAQKTVVDALLDRSLEAAHEPSRIRSLAGLKQAELSPEQLSRILRAAAGPGGSFEVRSWALELLGAKAGGLNGPQKLVIVGTVSDADPKLREIAVSHLKGLKDLAEARTAARAALSDPAWNVRYAAVVSVAGLEGTAARERLTAIAGSDPDGEVRYAARQALDMLGKP